jgi:hypothetical protein
MAPNEDSDDPAVYRTGSSKTVTANKSNGDSNGAEEAAGEEDEDMDEDSDEEDGTLLTVQPGFNRLLLVLRDVGVMRFVKYVSAAAEGSRWDVCGEYEVGMIEAEDEDD